MIEGHDVGSQSLGVGKHRTGIDHFVQAEFEVNHVAQQGCFLEVGGLKLKLRTLRCEDRLVLPQRLNIVIDRYQPPRRALDIEQVPGSDSNHQDNLIPEVIKVMEFSRELGSVDGQEAPPRETVSLPAFIRHD